MRQLAPSRLFTLACTLIPGAASASVIGFLGNFDVVNDTDRTAHGFEIELEDLHLSDITDTFGGPGRGFPTGKGFDPATAVERYGAPTISEFSEAGRFGVRVRYQASFDGANWDFGTPSGVYNASGEGCWTHGGAYGPGTPCDHFGVGTTRNATRTAYSWLLEGLTPGLLDKVSAAVPVVNWDVSPAPNPNPGAPAAPPVIAAAVEAPEVEVEEGSLFGDAIWVKVFTTEIEVEVELEHLIAGDPVIEQTETEIEWLLLQKEFGKPESGLLELGNGAPVGEDTKSVIRRYEFYSYAGTYNDEHEVELLFGDSNPDPSEIGNFIGAQNAAALLGEPLPAPVPVPAALWLFCPAIAGLAKTSRRRS